MITWITTIGWSPFAVINPIWAYCKEYEEYPDRIIIFYTPYKRIKYNLHICKKYITEILKSYNKKNFNENSIEEVEIENDNIQPYADRLSKIIQREKNQRTDKIILDMTPGRKYMSAINVYYGYSIAEIPIQVYYLHLEESKYQDVPYPLSPIIKNELIDILESSEIFSKDLEKHSEINEEKEEEKLEKEILKNIKTVDIKKDYLMILSIKKGFNTKTKIKKFTFGNGIIIRGHELDKILKRFTLDNLVSTHFIRDDNLKYKIYNLTEKGKYFLRDLGKKNINGKQEGD